METTEVTKYRREVLKRIAQYTWNECLPDRIYDILYKFVREDTPRVRCCVHKERAVLKNRIQMALWQPTGLNIINASNAALAGNIDLSLPVIDVLPAACDACPIEKYYITDVCRHCIQRKCIDQCPKKAISIQGNRAVIDHDECVGCGRCMQVCPFGAIIEVVRPCVKSCGAKAISVGPDERAVIDADKCVSCGNCRSACPFGALDERSLIVQVLMELKAKRKMTAMLAPSFVGQFGFKITPEQIVAALKLIGFTDVVSVAEGADMVTLCETEEFNQKVPKEQEFMTSSCCPAFVSLIKKHYPGLADNISETVSPMVACGRWIKERDKEMLTCFIGPCIAKKGEAINNPDSVDYVLTFEELQCIFEGIGIDLAQIKGEEYQSGASLTGMAFPLERGVQKSIEAISNNNSVVMKYADGIPECKEKLEQIGKGKLKIDYLEGMACKEGCIDGPGTLSAPGITRVLLTKYMQSASAKNSSENKTACKAVEKLKLSTE